MVISKEEVKDSVIRRLKRNFSKSLDKATRREIYDAVASTVMELIQSALEGCIIFQPNF